MCVINLRIKIPREFPKCLDSSYHSNGFNICQYGQKSILNKISNQIPHAHSWCRKVQTVQSVGGSVVVTGRLTNHTDDGDLPHYSAVASELMEYKSQSSAAEVTDSSCLRRAAAMAGLGWS